MVKKIVIGLLLLVLLLAAGVYGYLYSLLPVRSGEVSLAGLSSEVAVIFDQWGVPHIEAKSEEDAYRALGYLHAQERLFQIEIMSRLAQGRLSEILGAKTIGVDSFFRTLGLHRYVRRYERESFTKNDPKIQRAVSAYLQGVNQFVDSGPTPIEFTLLGIPKRHYSFEDLMSIGSYMAYSFTLAVRTDPLVTGILAKHGPAYLEDLALAWPQGAPKIELSGAVDTLSQFAALSADIEEWVNVVPPLYGSNSWVLAPSKTKSGRVLFANDPHIGFSAPSTWYEAHLKTPEWELYGHHLAGVPFALLGHSRSRGWGLTMMQNDDLDFYREYLNPKNSKEVMYKGEWVPLEEVEEVIQVKGEEPVTLVVSSSPHGPIINGVVDGITTSASEPVALSWAYLSDFDNHVFEVFYGLGHATSIEMARSAASKLHAPGLNISYGDVEGNIAWWASARLPIHPDHVNTKLLLDGRGGDEIIGYRDFSENPHSVNPPSGVLFNGNNQPDDMGYGLVPGYYAPPQRAERIGQQLKGNDRKWGIADMKKLQLDTNGPIATRLISRMRSAIETTADRSPTLRRAGEVALAWDGNHNLESVGATLYHRLFYHLSAAIMKDELGEEGFDTLLGCDLLDKSLPLIMDNPDSPWWDNTNSSAERETREEILVFAWDRAIESLVADYGDDLSRWEWGRVHTLEHVHLLGRQPPLDRLFNVGPFPAPGSKAVINQMRHKYGPGALKVFAGPSTRRIIDFGDPEHPLGINPIGQAGYFFDSHYGDQAHMYIEGEYRTELVAPDEIKASEVSRLALIPE